MPRILLNCLGIAGAGALGALARFGISQLFALFAGAGFPWATLCINVSGAFALGWIYKALETHPGTLNSWQLILGVGFLGAFTTFSSMMWESDSKIRDGNTARAATYLLASIILGLIAVRAGFILGQQFSGGPRP